MKKRVCFSKGDQKRFILYAKEKLCLSWKNFAEKLKIKENTLSKSYTFELCNITHSLFKKIISLLRKDDNFILNKYKYKIIKEKIIGGKVIGERKKVFSKINIVFRNKNLYLDCSKINYSKYDLQKKIKLQNKITPELAEEIGMHFGDGFLSETRYDYRLKGNPKDEITYYNNYIGPLFRKLYNINPKIKSFVNSYGFEISSKALWEFKTKIIGIKAGEKYDLIIPETLKVNNI